MKTTTQSPTLKSKSGMRSKGKPMKGSKKITMWLRQFKPSAKGKWDVIAPSTMQVSVGDQVRVTAGFREGKNVFKNNYLVEVREVTDTELILRDGRRMR